MSSKLYLIYIGFNLAHQTYQQIIRNEAIDQCLAAGKMYFEKRDAETGALVSSSEIPSQETYVNCMRDKGYSLE